MKTTTNQNRPKLKLEMSQTDRFIEAGSILLLLGTWILAIWNFRYLPEMMPSHTNLAGEIDGYTSRIWIFLMPVISTITFVMMMILSRYPHVFNYPLEVTEETAPRVYAFSVRMVRTLNLGVVALFFLSEYMIIQMAFGHNTGPSLWLIILLVLMIIPFLIYSINKLFKLGRVKK